MAAIIKTDQVWLDQTTSSTVGAPAIIFGADYLSGLYRIGTNNIGLTINGTKLLDMSSGAVAITGTLSTTGTLSATGAITGNATAGGNIISHSSGYGLQITAASAVNQLRLTRTGSATADFRNYVSGDGWYVADLSGTGGSVSLSADGELTNTCPTGNKYALTPVNSHASNPFGIYNRFTGADPNSTGNSFLYCEGSTAGGTLRAGIRSNGGLANYSGNNVNLSDLDVKPFTQAFDAEKLWRFGKAMRPAWMQFKYDDQTHDDWNNGYGAQLVQEAAGTDFPELVSLGNWGTNDEPKMRLEVYDNDLIHIMCAITTESQFKIDALEARLAALEAK